MASETQPSPTTSSTPRTGPRHAVPAQRRPDEPRGPRRPHLVIAVVNLPAEKDRRVIRETRALEAAGYRVTIICPRGPKNLRQLPGSRDARLRTFRQPFAGSGVVSFAVEFAWSFLCVGWHLLRLVAS